VRLVVGLGGNALLRRGERPDIATQRRNLRGAAAAIAELARHHALVITHGNGPQIGLLALREAAFSSASADPLDVLGAESEGMIGYQIEQELAPLLPGRDIATLLTQVEIDPDDPALTHPTKPNGPLYDSTGADRLAAANGWRFAPEGGRRRRVVPSPAPRRIREIAAIRRLLEAGVIVICAGGGAASNERTRPG
jgi:carbamate kinase